MKLFKICFFLILCVVAFSGCLNNGTENDSSPEIKASGPESSTFSGNITNISVSENYTLLTLETEYESYYGQKQMTFIVNNETDNNFHTWSPEVDKYMFIRYWLPIDGNLQSPSVAVYAEVQGDVISSYNGTVQNISKSQKRENAGIIGIILDNGTHMVCHYSSPATYFADDIRIGMKITACTSGAATVNPLESWPNEI